MGHIRLHFISLLLLFLQVTFLEANFTLQLKNQQNVKNGVTILDLETKAEEEEENTLAMRKRRHRYTSYTPYHPMNCKRKLNL